MMLDANPTHTRLIPTLDRRRHSGDSTASQSAWLAGCTRARAHGHGHGHGGAAPADSSVYEVDRGASVHRLRSATSRLTRLSSDPTRYTPPPCPDPELTYRLRRLMRSQSLDLIYSYGW